MLIPIDSGTLDLVPHENQDPSAWKRLGKLLIARRVALGWLKRSAFVDAHADRLKNSRTIEAIENGERMNFSPSMLAQVENVYQWKPGSIDDVLDGGDPTPLDADVKVVHELPLPAADRLECHAIIDDLRDEQLPEARRILRDLHTAQG